MQVLEGEFSLADHNVNYASGTSIAHWPEGGGLVARDLNNQGEWVGTVHDSLQQPGLNHNYLSRY